LGGFVKNSGEPLKITVFKGANLDAYLYTPYIKGLL